MISTWPLFFMALVFSYALLAFAFGSNAISGLADKNWLYRLSICEQAITEYRYWDKDFFQR